MFIRVKIGLKIAIKLLTNDFNFNGSDELKEIFQRDSRALSMLDHKNIIEYKDSGIVDNKFYIIMEYFESMNLEEFLGSRKLDYKEILGIIKDILYGVSEAHTKRIIHRDLKPTNVLISNDLKVKVIDFGVSKILDLYAHKSGFTLKNHITKKYASPEQILGNEADFQSDIFSIGSIFYFLLTGIEPPEAKEELFNSIDQIEHNELVKGILRKALAINKSQRYLNIASFINDIEDEISNIYTQGNIKLFVPPYMIKELYERGIITSNTLPALTSFIYHSLEEANIYKTHNQYYLIGE